MILKSLYLRNFRNIKHAKMHFSSSLNVFYGKNAQGKTNLLEAIFLLCTGKSFRTKNYKECILHGQESFYIEALIEKEGVEQTLSIHYHLNEKVITINATKYHSFQALLGQLPSVLHMSHDQSLISGSPSIRRRFLNLFIAQFDALYVHHLSRYLKAMKNRNILLKKRSLKTIDVWEIEMAKSAYYISQCRKKAVADLNLISLDILHKLTNQNYPFSLKHTPSFDHETDNWQNLYLESLQKNRYKDMKFGFTSLGPHRDDFMIYLDNQIAKLFASEGQKRTFLSALSLAEQNFFTEKLHEQSLMHVDDLDVHLDRNHQKLLHLFLTKIGQVFITTPTSIDPFMEEKATFFHVENGEIKVKNPPDEAKMQLLN